MQENCKIRQMEIRDLFQVMVIEKSSFPDPWSAFTFYRELTQNKVAHYWVAVKGQKILGYCGAWMVMDEAQITNIAVHANYRGLGMGERLLVHTINECRKKGVKKLTLEVRASNLAAQRLYRKVGFNTIGVRPRFYKICPEDAILMGVRLDEKVECAWN